MEKLTAACSATLSCLLALEPKRRLEIVIAIAAVLVLIIILVLMSSSRVETELKFNDECLRAHNALREKHRADNLTFDEDLAEAALKHAKYLASEDTFQHSNYGYGENIYWSSDYSQDGCKSVVDKWYQENKDWFYRSGSGNPYRATGHFTQVVWRSTLRVGCARHDKGDGKMKGVFVVCEYDPPGNIGDRMEYKKNVKVPIRSKPEE